MKLIQFSLQKSLLIISFMTLEAAESFSFETAFYGLDTEPVRNRDLSKVGTGTIKKLQFRNTPIFLMKI
jgi:hypothetical protein